MTKTIDGPGDVGRNMVLTAISNFVVPLSALVTAPVLAHSLGVDGRGTLAAATAPLILFVTISMLGLPEAATYWVAKYAQQAKAILRKAILLLAVAGLLSSIGAIFMAPIIASGDENLTALVGGAALAIVPSIGVGAFRGTAAGLHRWDLVNTERYVGAVVRLVAIVVLALLDQLTPATAVATVALAPVLAGFTYIQLIRYIGDGLLTSPRVSSGQLLGYGLRVWIGSASGILLSRIDQVLLAPLSNTFQLGLYAAAVTVSEAALLANNAVRDVTLSADATDSVDKRIELSARISFLVSITVGLVLSLTLPMWFTVVFGEEFAAAIPVTIILIIACVVGVPGSVAGAGLSARGRPGLRSTGLVIAAAINIFLLVFWVPDLGAIGAAYATLVGNIVAANLNVFLMKAHFGVRIRDYYVIRASDVTSLRDVILRLLRKVRQSDS